MSKEELLKEYDEAFKQLYSSLAKVLKYHGLSIKYLNQFTLCKDEFGNHYLSRCK